MNLRQHTLMSRADAVRTTTKAAQETLRAEKEAKAKKEMERLQAEKLALLVEAGSSWYPKCLSKIEASALKGETSVSIYIGKDKNHAIIAEALVTLLKKDGFEARLDNRGVDEHDTSRWLEICW